ncbi:hypothetical protein PG990_011884 [Apiospora arundinis]
MLHGALYASPTPPQGRNVPVEVVEAHVVQLSELVGIALLGRPVVGGRRRAATTRRIHTQHLHHLHKTFVGHRGHAGRETVRVSSPTSTSTSTGASSRHPTEQSGERVGRRVTTCWRGSCGSSSCGSRVGIARLRRSRSISSTSSSTSGLRASSGLLARLSTHAHERVTGTKQGGKGIVGIGATLCLASRDSQASPSHGIEGVGRLSSGGVVATLVAGGVLSVTPGAGKAAAPPPPPLRERCMRAALRRASGFVIMWRNMGDRRISRALGLFLSMGFCWIIMSRNWSLFIISFICWATLGLLSMLAICSSSIMEPTICVNAYTTVGPKHVGRGKAGQAGIASARQASQRVVGSAGGHVGGHLGSGGGGGGSGRSGRGVAGGALDQMHGVARLYLVCAQRLLVLHDAARVDEALALDGDVLVVLGGELGLEVVDGGSLGHGEGVFAITRRLHVEGDLGIRRSLCVVGHGEATIMDNSRGSQVVVGGRCLGSGGS